MCVIYEIVLKGKNKNAFLRMCFLPTSFVDDLLIILYKRRKSCILSLRDSRRECFNKQAKAALKTSEKFLVLCLKMKWNCL